VINFILIHEGFIYETTAFNDCTRTRVSQFQLSIQSFPLDSDDEVEIELAPVSFFLKVYEF
jgi:hypothetical protein